MKLNSKHIIFLLIICILLGITAVSATDNQAVDADYGLSQSMDDMSIDEDIVVDESVSDEENIDSGDLLNDEGDYHNFTELNQSISQSENELNLSDDYRYDGTFIEINKASKFTLNGNNHIIEGNDASSNEILLNVSSIVVINNLTFQNCGNSMLEISSQVTFNNVNFINCSGDELRSFIDAKDQIVFENCIFQNSRGNSTNLIECENADLTFKNTVFNGGWFDKGLISENRGNLYIENCTFENISSRLASAINFKGWNLTIQKSRFIDLHAEASAGAIMIKYFQHLITDENRNVLDIIPNGPFVIEDCEFINLTSGNDGGAIHFDMDSAKGNATQSLNMINVNFTNCEAKYGGAISGLGGILNISNAIFENDHASFEGGAIYTSWANVSLNHTVLSNGSAIKNAGAIYFDKGQLTIINSILSNNKVEAVSGSKAGAIYAHDAILDFSDSTFDNGGLSVYADFAGDSKIDNVEKNNDIFSLDNKDYMVSVESNGVKIKLINNSVVADKLPSKFDARDWGWCTPIKVQGDNDDCWAFATAASLETALLKSTGVEYDLSANYGQKLQLKYAINGDLRNSLTGFSYSGVGYALSWYGALFTDAVYDDRGMIADTDFADERIHVQDVVFIYGSGLENVDLIKKAIMEYGAVSIQMITANKTPVESEGEDIAIMDHNTHFISLIGWDDALDDPDKKGHWIHKDSLGGFFDILTYEDTQLIDMDYYAIVPQRVAVAYIFENDIDYHVNYQTDLTGLVGFDENYTYYSNEFVSKYDELIGAVGTYFNESGINYSFDVFVNGAKVHTQTGKSEFAGFRTIVLNKYIPIKTGDVFKVVFKNNALPYQAYSRQHYVPGMSLVSNDGSSWTDLSTVNKTVCLKVYTVADDTKIINNKDASVNYGAGSYFSVKVVTADGRPVGAGEKVTFTINGRTVTATTDNNGIAKIKITEVPGKYAIKTDYRGISYQNNVAVKLDPKTCKVVGNKNIKVDYAGGKYFSVKVVSKDGKVPASGVKVKFKINGKTYTKTTNKKGIAKLKITFIPKKYTIKTIFNGKTYKNTIKVKQVLKTSKVTVKKTAKKFTLKAKLKINGKLKKGKTIKFRLNGKTYKAKTNKKGIAKVTIKKKVIKKLKKGKKYAFKVTYLKDTIKSTVKVK